MNFSEKNCDNNYMRYVGYEQSGGDFLCIKKLYSRENIDYISKKITQLTKGLRSDNKLIIVTDEVICDVLSTVQNTFVPRTGDIYSRYTILDSETKTPFERIVEIAIEVIYSSLKNQMGVDKCNKNLTIWNSLLGDFNKQGLIQHPPIKVRKKKTQSMFFFENY